MVLTWVKGNIFDSTAEATVNTVNTKGVMGKGIALQFKKNFPEMFKAYAKACQENAVVIGKMHVWQNSAMFGPRFVINFPTKDDWRHPSKIEYIQSGLQDLVGVIKDFNIKSIAIPPLGCGNGGLDWNLVKPIIVSALGELTGVDVHIYAPADGPMAVKNPSCEQEPKMTVSRALVIKLLEQYCVLGYELTLLEIQKLLYFLQEFGEPLKLKYEKHLYGPYADNLRHVLHVFEGHFIQGFGDGTRNKPDTVIQLLPNAVKHADSFLSSGQALYSDSFERFRNVKRLIEGFETPYGMELLSTVHWLVVHEHLDIKDESKIINAVHNWNPRKAAVMRPEHITKAACRISRFLEECGSKVAENAY
jgi:O-acetyl-ADP-ribose deacetylase (regulator of RNase III)